MKNIYKTKEQLLKELDKLNDKITELEKSEVARKRAEEEIQLLQTITRAIAQSQDLHSALEVTLCQVAEATGWDFGEAWLPNSTGTALEHSSAGFSSSKDLEKFRRLSEKFTFPPDVGLPGRVWSSQQPEWIPDTSVTSEINFIRTQQVLDFDLKAGFGVPIISDDKVLAVLVFLMYETRDEDKRLIELISAVAAQLGLVIQRKQTEVKLNKANRLYATLSQINQTIVRERDKQKLFQEICNIAIEYGKFRLAWIGLVDEEKKIVIPAAFSGEGSDYLQNIKILLSDDLLRKGPTGRSIHEGKSIVFNDLENNPDFAPWRKQALEKGYRSSAAFPIRLNNLVIGAFNVYAVEPHFFDEDEIKLLEEAALDISFALEKFREEDKHKQVEEELQEHRDENTKLAAIAKEQAELQDWINTFDTFVGKFDPNGVGIIFNKAPMKAGGVTIDDVVGKYFPDTKWWSHSEVDRATIVECLEQAQAGLSSRTETNFRSADGTPVPIIFNCQPVMDADGKVKYITAEGKTIVEETRLRTELESFAYSVSHDMRAPLRAIDGFTRILMEDYAEKLDDEGKRLGTVIRDNTQKMGKLIDDLLSFSRLGRAAMHFSDIDMEKLANSIYYEATNVEERKRIKLTIGDMPRAEGDTTMIRQVWMNLISNALKFSSQRKRAVISISCYEEKDNLTYCIKDNGAGFNMKYKDKLFDVFQRLHSEKEFEGTGVGLALVQRIIYRHGGNVWAEGKVDTGAEFFFSLPKKGEPKNES